MIMSLQQRNIKFEPGIKLNHNRYIGSSKQVFFKGDCFSFPELLFTHFLHMHMSLDGEI